MFNWLFWCLHMCILFFQTVGSKKNFIAGDFFQITNRASKLDLSDHMNTQILWSLKSHDLSDIMISQISWSLRYHDLPDIMISQISWYLRSHGLSDLMVSQISWSPRSNISNLRISQIAVNLRSHDLSDPYEDIRIWFSCYDFATFQIFNRFSEGVPPSLLHSD